MRYIVPSIILMLALTACDAKDEPKYSPADVPAASQRVYFAEASETQVVTDDATSFNVYLYRPEQASAEALTVQLLVTDESGLFRFPEEVEFEAGQHMTPITVGYDPTVMQTNYVYKTYISIDEANADTYGIATLELGINLEALTDWELFGYDPESGRNGYGVWTLGSPFSGNFINMRVFERHIPTNPDEIQYAVQLNIPAGLEGEYPEDEIDTSNTNYSDSDWITAIQMSSSDGGKTIEIPVQNCVFYDGIYFAEASVLYPSSFLNNESYFDAVSGTFYLNLMYADSEGAWNPAVNTIALYGYADTNDYSITLTDLDQVSIDGKDYALIGIQKSEHVDEVRYTIVKGELSEDEIDAVVKSISDEETTEYEVAVVTESQNIAVVLPSAATYTMVAIGLHTDNTGSTEVKTTASLVFDYDTFDPYAGWTTVTSTATYTDNLFEYIFGASPMDLTVEVAKSDEFDGYYRITNPFATSPYVPMVGKLATFGSIEFVVNDDNSVYFPESDTGILYQNDPIIIVSYSALLLANGSDEDAIASAGLFGKYAAGQVTMEAQPEDSDGNLTTGMPSFLFALGNDGYYILNMPFSLDMNSTASSDEATLSRVASSFGGPTLMRSTMKAPVWPTPFRAVGMGVVTPTKRVLTPARKDR